jgi:hypothetical protein
VILRGILLQECRRFRARCGNFQHSLKCLDLSAFRRGTPPGERRDHKGHLLGWAFSHTGNGEMAQATSHGSDGCHWQR